MNSLGLVYPARGRWEQRGQIRGKIRKANICIWDQHTTLPLGLLEIPSTCTGSSFKCGMLVTSLPVNYGPQPWIGRGRGPCLLLPKTWFSLLIEDVLQWLHKEFVPASHCLPQVLSWAPSWLYFHNKHFTANFTGSPGSPAALGGKRVRHSKRDRVRDSFSHWHNAYSCHPYAPGCLSDGRYLLW